jgi:phosphate transport system permease protein
MESGLSAWRLTQIRTIGAFLVLFIYVYLKNKQSLKIKAKELPILIVFGVFGFAAVNLLYFLAIQRLNVGIALIISLPIGILTAIYLTEIRGFFTRPIQFLVQAMSGVPSIVAGLFILSAIVFPITKTPSGLMAGLALSILMIPTIARTSEEVLLLIPPDLREAGIALGGTQWRTISQIVVPAAKSGLITAIILGVARVAGETAPLVLVSGGGDAINLNPTSGPMGSFPFYIWKSFTFGTNESIARAWAGIFVLLVLIFILFIAARLLGGDRNKK